MVNAKKWNVRAKSLTNMHDIVKQISVSFGNNAHSENALAMAAYMKNNFPFWGIKTEKRRSLQTPFYAPFKVLDKKEQQAIIKELWSMPEREFHYFAMDLASKIVKKTDQSWLSFWEPMLITNAWWDSVDFIAPSLIGPLLKNDVALQEEYSWKWMESDKLWKQRAALIFQIKYKDKTNAPLLFDLVLSCAASKEFFLRKGSGWALREYGKTSPLEVSQFVNRHKDQLSGLTVREAIRRL